MTTGVKKKRKTNKARSLSLEEAHSYVGVETVQISQQRQHPGGAGGAGSEEPGLRPTPATGGL